MDQKCLMLATVGTLAPELQASQAEFFLVFNKAGKILE